MAWEQRGTKGYYYRSVRHGRRVTRTYIASGTFGLLAAALDAEERAARQAKVEAWRKARTDMEALDAQIAAWWDASNALVDATLRAQGYYRHHRGAWRKRGRRGPAPHPA